MNEYHWTIENSFFGSWLHISLVLIVTVFYIACLWRIFAKAGQPGWAAIIPIYNMVILFRVGQMNPWWVLALFVPILNLVIYIMVLHRISRSFGHGVGFTVGLFLLSFIFIPILAFGSDTYRKLED